MKKNYIHKKRHRFYLKNNDWFYMNRGQRKYDKKKKMNGKARSCADTL
jgi:hypothetical protein